MFTSIIHTISGSKFQIDPITVTLFSGSGPTPPPPSLAKSQNAIHYRVKLQNLLGKVLVSKYCETKVLGKQLSVKEQI